MSVSIWVVDDDRSIRWVLEKALGQEGYAVTCFEDADEALNTLEQGGQEPEVLISDVRMHGWAADAENFAAQESGSAGDHHDGAFRSGFRRGLLPGGRV